MSFAGSCALRTAAAAATLAVLACLGSGQALAEPVAAPGDPAPVVVAPAPTTHPSPRLKLALRGFQIANLDATQVGLTGAQLDVYVLSRRWVRVGIEAEAGSGRATLDGQAADLWYGLGGISLGLQYPARVTPFVEGRFAAGALGGHWTGATAVALSGGNVSVQDARVTTLMYLGGVDAGVELYAFDRFYLTLALGWAHPVYQGVDYAAMKANPLGPMQPRAIAADTFTFKLGIGI